MGESIPMQRIGIVGHSIKAKPSVRMGMLAAFDALRSVSNTVELVPWFDDSPARVEMRVAFEHPVFSRLIAEFHAAAFAETCRREPDRAEFLLQEVAFSHAAPADVSPYLDFFKCPVRFSQPRHLLTFDAAWLAQEHVSADHDLHEALAPFVRDVMAPLAPSRGWAERTRAEARVLLETGKFDLETLGRRLGVKPRTLQHKLRGEGITFSRLVDGVRKELALRTLAAKNPPVTELAYLVGMELPSFYRAFRRWTGMTPQAFRARGAGPAPAQGEREPA
jgi:AraC-like DNA-binding protein